MQKAVKTLVYDPVHNRPACVILQAVMGGSVEVGDMFPSESWLLAPTPDMKTYKVTDEEIAILVDLHRLKIQQKNGGRR